MTVSVIVPVFNGAHHVGPCISQLRSATRRQDEIILVDDGSDAQTANLLAEYDRVDHRIRLIRHPQNLGFVAAANTGLASSTGDCVVVLNSDTLVFEGFAARFESVFSADSAIGIANPVSNWAGWTRVPNIPGLDARRTHELVRDLPQESREVDIGVASGFCFAISRRCLDATGEFDPAYAPGYWEETDYCMRARAGGFRIVCVCDLFVFHHGWGSFGARRHALMARNESRFLKRWSREYFQLVGQKLRHDPLAKLRRRLMEAGRKAHRPYQRTVCAADELRGTVPDQVLVTLLNRLVLAGLAVEVLTSRPADRAFRRCSPWFFSPDTPDVLERHLREHPAALVIGRGPGKLWPALRSKAEGNAGVVLFLRDGAEYPLSLLSASTAADQTITLNDSAPAVIAAGHQPLNVCFEGTPGIAPSQRPVDLLVEPDLEPAWLARFLEAGLVCVSDSGLPPIHRGWALYRSSRFVLMTKRRSHAYVLDCLRCGTVPVVPDPTVLPFALVHGVNALIPANCDAAAILEVIGTGKNLRPRGFESETAAGLPVQAFFADWIARLKAAPALRKGAS